MTSIGCQVGTGCQVGDAPAVVVIGSTPGVGKFGIGCTVDNALVVGVLSGCMVEDCGGGSVGTG